MTAAQIRAACDCCEAIGAVDGIWVRLVLPVMRAVADEIEWSHSTLGQSRPELEAAVLPFVKAMTGEGE